jgi:hypothetical protein
MEPSMDDPTKQAELAKLLASGPIGDMSHADLYRLRGLSPPEAQPGIAPLEHRAFAREFTQEHPVLGAGMPIAALGYWMGKRSGLIKSRTPADMDQVFGAVQGTLQGYGLDK